MADLNGEGRTTWETYKVSVKDALGAVDLESISQLQLPNLPNDTKSIRFYCNTQSDKGISFVAIVTFSRSVENSRIIVAFTGNSARETADAVMNELLEHIERYRNKLWTRKLEVLSIVVDSDFLRRRFP